MWEGKGNRNSAATSILASSPNRFSFVSHFPPYTSTNRNTQTQEGGGGAGGEALLRLPRVALAQPWHQDHYHYQDLVLASSSSSPTSSLPISCSVPSLCSYYSSSACPAPSQPSCPPRACHHLPCPNAHQGKQGVNYVCARVVRELGSVEARGYFPLLASILTTVPPCHANVQTCFLAHCCHFRHDDC